MKIKSLSLPHPVLNLRDDLEGELEVKFDVNFTKDKVFVSTKGRFSNSSIKRLINEERAVFCMEVDCPSTVYKRGFLSKELEFEKGIDRSIIRNKLTVGFYIVATKDISSLEFEGANSIYGTNEFSIEKGDVIGYGGEVSFPVLSSWKEAESPSSIMEIESRERRKIMEVILRGHKIKIVLPEEDKKSYQKTSDFSNIAAIHHAILVLPVLTYAIRRSIGNENEYSDLKWFQIIKYRKTMRKN